MSRRPAAANARITGFEKRAPGRSRTTMTRATWSVAVSDR